MLAAMTRQPATLALLVPALLVAGAAACGKAKPKGDPPAAGSGGAARAIDAGATAAGPVAVDAATARPAPPAPPTITKEARATYRKQLEAGRKAAKATRWPEAIAAFEAALAAVPGDDRALSELSFAAMSAGDATRARDAGRRAVLAATEAKIKAAALYNLGRVEESTQPTLAASLYRQSLALRPNKIVEKRLAELGKALPAAVTPEPLACATLMTRKALCDCLSATGELPPDERRCEVTDTAVAGIAYATYARSEMGQDAVALVAGAGDRWQVIGELATIYNPGAFGISEDWSLTSATERELGGRQVIELRSSWSRRDSDLGLNEVEIEERESLLVCVRATPGAVPSCPLEVPLRSRYERDVLMDDLSPEELAEIAPYKTAGLPIKSEGELSVELGADGVAHVRAVKGRWGGELLGDRKLW
jgi:hypothetical protein